MVRALRLWWPKCTRCQGNRVDSDSALAPRSSFCEETGKLLWHRWTAALRGTVMCRLLNNVSEVVGCG
jgi:hypothetical protein